jgi:hypothetical protein
MTPWLVKNLYSTQNGRNRDSECNRCLRQLGRTRKRWSGNMGTSMISKSQEETEVSERLEEKALEAEMRRLG